MRRYYATLHKDVDLDVGFESLDGQTGKNIAEYSIPTTLKAGRRQFRTMKAAKAWVAHMNKEYGQHTASLSA